MTCCTGPLILIIGSTVVWLLSLVVAVEESLKAASLKEKSIIYDYLMLVIIDTVAWATVMFNVCWPWWPPFAFVLLVWLFLVELMYEP
ncbi:MAG: hypothetical protein L7G95_06795 [Acidilobus sp.]|nr:hypothetical protein [Acidilobus sp.]